MNTLFINNLNFNPRSHKGSDDLPAVCLPPSGISIHAPTRGATRFRLREPQFPVNFNPRSHKGSDAGACRRISCVDIFQSTLPQGERQQFYTKFHICFISFLPILSPYHISTHSPLPTFNHFLYIFSGANRPEISCLLPFRTKTISGIL